MTEPPAPLSLTEAWLRDIETEAAAGRWDRAMALAGRALDLGLSHARFHLLRAETHRRGGRFGAARADLEQAHALDGDDPGILQALAAAVAQTDPKRARALLERSVDRAPQVAELHGHLGVARLRVGDVKAADDAFRDALALNPRLAAAWGRRAILASNRGDPVAARDYAERALAIDPHEPNGRRAAIEAALDRREPGVAERSARAWLSTGRLDPVARSHAAGLLADALDAQGRYPEAFDAYAASKVAFTEAYAADFGHRQSQPISETISNMRGEFDALPRARWRPAQVTATVETPARTHVFLLGFMRSGTTLLEQSLALHPDVAVLEETEALAEAGAEHLGQPGGLTRIAKADGETLDRWRVAYWSAVAAAGVDAQDRILVDKLPFNGLKLPLIARLFPNARIVFARRDPRDVVLSCFQRRLQTNAYTFEMRTLDGSARLYDAYMQTVFAFREGLDLALLDHRHEDMIADIEAAVRRVCDFIGLKVTAAMTEPARAVDGGAVLSQSARQIGQGVNASGLARWRRYREAIRPVEPILAPWIARLGYPRD